jgi:hypothetical protein
MGILLGNATDFVFEGVTMTPDQAIEELVQLGLICLNCSVVDEDVLLVPHERKRPVPVGPVGVQLPLITMPCRPLAV